MKLIYTALLAFVLLFVFIAEGSSYSYSSDELGRRHCGHGRRWYICKPCYRDCESSRCGRRGRHSGYRGSGGYSGSGVSSYLYDGSDLGSYVGDYCPCKPGCACTDGKYWDKRRGKCVRRCRRDYCPGNQVCRCVKCVKKCPSAYSYGYQSSRCYAYRCRKQCACPKGKYLNKNGRCVRKCRSRFGGHNWQSASG